MMRTFVRRDSRGEYASPNFAVAAEGFRQLGREVVGYGDVSEIVQGLTRDDIVVDFVDESRQALEHLGVALPAVPTYPGDLARFLGRKIWASTINRVAASPEEWPVFVKPRDDSKNFTGVLVRSTRDLIGCGDPEYNTPVWCSAPLRFLREWRCFVRSGEIVDVRPYKGDWRVHHDSAVIEDAVSAWKEQPQGCALDFGLDEHRRTVLVEVNDGFALGAYGLLPIEYARLLAARWTELVDVTPHGGGRTVEADSSPS